MASLLSMVCDFGISCVELGNTFLLPPVLLYPLGSHGMGLLLGKELVWYIQQFNWRKLIKEQERKWQKPNCERRNHWD